jgi:DNA-binding NarL/FixJ family response regulator
MRDISMLTGRERDVLRRIGEGESAKQIARGLEISPATVRSHVRSIYVKLDIRTRAQAAALVVDARMTGVIGPCPADAVQAGARPAVSRGLDGCFAPPPAAVVADARLAGAIGSRPADATGSRPADVVGAGAGTAVSRGFDDRFLNRCLAPPPAPFDALTRREVEVLRCMAAGIPRRAIAERLVLSPNTVRTHARNVLAKLGVHSSLAAAALLRRVMCAPAG